MFYEEVSVSLEVYAVISVSDTTRKPKIVSYNHIGWLTCNFQESGCTGDYYCPGKKVSKAVINAAHRKNCWICQCLQRSWFIARSTMNLHG